MIGPGPGYTAGESRRSRDAMDNLMREVHLPTMRDLMTSSLSRLNAIIGRMRAEEDPERWAACHVLLGCALRLRSSRKEAHRRAPTLVGAVRAFDAALAIYYTPNARQHSAASRAPDGASHKPCGVEFDGVQLVTVAVALPLGVGNDLLEQAVVLLRQARRESDRGTADWSWVTNTSNLACALTLLGNRAPAAVGIDMLHEAVEMLQELLRLQPPDLAPADMASAQVNLAEALLAISERAMPGERLRYLEQAIATAADALLVVAPPAFGWVLTLEPAGLA